MDRWQYLIVLGACLLITLPLEWLGSGIYRRPRRLVLAVLPVAAVFVAWDVVATAAGVWRFEPRYVIGIDLLSPLPVEELLFFLIVPVCGLLTYGAVNGILDRLRRRRTRVVGSA